MKVHHIMMASVLLFLTSCERVHVKGDEIVHSGEQYKSGMISAGDQQGLSNYEDQGMRTGQANEQGLRYPDEHQGMRTKRANEQGLRYPDEHRR